ncbi:head-tail connector protein [Paenochrobactrum pullorum]|uniref:head-tail connector protein n=1 Tax=Paenochrobactrum pullorum TaxID=1324351 RepID=UPI0035BB9FC0
MAVTLEKFKKHLRVEFDDEDDLIQTYLDAGKAWALSYVRRDAVPDGADAEFDAAIMLQAASMYENRESDITGTIHTEIPTATRLIDPYRRMSV